MLSEGPDVSSEGTDEREDHQRLDKEVLRRLRSLQRPLLPDEVGEPYADEGDQREQQVRSQPVRQPERPPREGH